MQKCRFDFVVTFDLYISDMFKQFCAHKRVYLNPYVLQLSVSVSDETVISENAFIFFMHLKLLLLSFILVNKSHLKITCCCFYSDARAIKELILDMSMCAPQLMSTINESFNERM